MNDQSSITIGKKKFILVKFPGVVKNEDKAINMLGGLDSIQNSFFKKTGPIELRFRPQDPNCHPCFSDSIEANDLLVKITKKNSKIEKIEVVGKVEKMIHFEGMTDFQYLEPKEERISFPPFIFSRSDKEFVYKFKDNPHSTEITIQQGDGTVQKQKKIVNPIRLKTIITVQFEIPFTPPEPLKTKEDEEFDKVLKNLFEKREIWSFKALKSQCVNDYEHRKLKSLIGYHAYYISNGPWRSLWCKFGVNPSSSSEYGRYQLVDLRVPPQLRDNIQRKIKSNPNKPTRMKSSSNEEETFDFIFDDIPHQHQVYYQLCDIPLYSFQKLVKDVALECDKISGWYFRVTIDKMREVLKKKLELWIEKGMDNDSDIYSAVKFYRDLKDSKEVVGSEEEIPDLEVVPEFEDITE